MTDIDDVPKLEIRKAGDALLDALITSYTHATTHISEFAKLQYQLVAIAYGLAGAAIAFFGNQLSQQASSNQFDTNVLLVLPFIFYAISFVQIYLHSQIKRYGRYVNYHLRPKVEAIVEANMESKASLSLWDWEEEYTDSIVSITSPQPKKSTNSFSLLATKTANFITRLLSVIIMALPLVPAISAIFLWESQAHQPLRSPLTSVELFVRGANIGVGLFIVVLIILIGWVNSSSLEAQGAIHGKNEKALYKGLLEAQSTNSAHDIDEETMVHAFLDMETDPTKILQVSLLVENQKYKTALQKQATILWRKAHSNEQK